MKKILIVLHCVTLCFPFFLKFVIVSSENIDNEIKITSNMPILWCLQALEDIHETSKTSVIERRK